VSVPCREQQRAAGGEHSVAILAEERRRTAGVFEQVAVQRGHPDPCAARDLCHRDLGSRIGEGGASGRKDPFAVALRIGSLRWLLGSVESK
jgi:hypothetical protein